MTHCSELLQYLAGLPSLSHSRVAPKPAYARFANTLAPQRLHVLAPRSPKICRPMKYQILGHLSKQGPVADTEHRLGTLSPERGRAINGCRQMQAKKLAEEPSCLFHGADFCRYDVKASSSRSRTRTVKNCEKSRASSFSTTMELHAWLCGT